MPDVVPDWITATQRSVDRASGAVETNRELEALVKVGQELDGIIDELTKLQKAGALGRANWWSGVDVSADLVSDLDNASRLLDSRRLASLNTNLTKFVRTVRSSMLAAWRAYLRQTAGHAEELHGLVGVLADGGGKIADIARELDNAPDILAKLDRKLPGDVEVVTLNRILALYSAFESELPPTVKSFVAATARGGAVINMLTAEVLTWLANNGVLDRFRIVVGNPNEAAHG